MKLTKNSIKNKRRTKVIFLTLFITSLLILIFNSYTQIFSNWINISIGVFSLILAVVIMGIIIYGLWLVLRDEYLLE